MMDCGQWPWPDRANGPACRSVGAGPVRFPEILGPTRPTIPENIPPWDRPCAHSIRNELSKNGSIQTACTKKSIELEYSILKTVKYLV